MKMKLKQDRQDRGLCYRCERRALFLEGHGAMRYECGGTNAVGCCYGYLPVKPITVKHAKGYGRRPMLYPLALSARVERKKDPELTLEFKVAKSEFVFYWIPK